METDSQLARRANQGDMAALDTLIQRHLPGLHAHVQRNTGPAMRIKESPSDIVQSVCREVVEEAQKDAGLPQPEDPDGFRQWLYKKALWRISDKYRFHHRAKRDIRREIMDSEFGQRDAPRGQGPISLVISEERRHRLDAALSQLSELEQLIVRAVRFENRPYEELAEQLDRTPGAVRALHSRALNHLALLLSRDDDVCDT